MVFVKKQRRNWFPIRYWNENPPAYDPFDNFFGQWVSYDPNKGFSSGTDRNEVHNFAAHNIVVLCYRSENYPAKILQEAFHDQTALLYEDSLILPVSKYLFDRKSCKVVMLSAHAPPHRVNTWQGEHFAPQHIFSSVLHRPSYTTTAGA